MGLFDRFRTKERTVAVKVAPTKRKRASKAEMTERVRAKIESQLALKRSELALAELDRKIKATQGDGGDNDEHSIQITELARLGRQLKPLHLEIRPIGDGPAAEGGMGNLPAIMEQLPNLAMAFRMFQGQPVPTIEHVPASPIVQSISTPEQQTPQASPQQMAQPAPAATPPVAEQTAQSVEPQPVVTNLQPPNIRPQALKEMSLASQILVEKMDGKAPREAAAWLVAEKNPIATTFVGVLLSTPDESLGQLIGSMATNNPALVGFAGWLAERWPWFVEVVHELRVLQTPKKDGMGL